MDTKHHSLNQAAAMRPQHLVPAVLPGSPLGADDTQLSLPGCEIISRLGKGGMGVVFLGRQERLNRYVAVKMLTAESAKKWHLTERFEQEAVTLATLNHPNIVGCYDIVSNECGTFLLMELVPGQLTVQDLILRFRRMPEHIAFRIALDAVHGLNAAHEKGILHGDVKPENLLFFWDSHVPPHDVEDLYKPGDARVMICDFGIARQEHPATGTQPIRRDKTRILGTPSYMAPETIDTGTVSDHRSDIYSLGTVVYQLLTGELPYHGDDAVDILRRKAQMPLPDPRKLGVHLSEQAVALLGRMCAINPDDRYLNYRELVADLQNLLRRHDESPAGAIGHRSLPSFWRGLALGLGCLLLVLVAWGSLHWRNSLVELPISKAASLGYWEGNRGDWRVAAPDSETDAPALTGLRSGSPLRLKQQLQPGQKVHVKTRIPSHGVICVSLVESNAPRCVVTWARQDGEQSCHAAADGAEIPLAEIPERDPMEWFALDLHLRPKSILISVDGDVVGFAPLSRHVGVCELIIEVTDGRLIQFRDIWVLNGK